MARKRVAELREAVERIAPVAPIPWTKEDHERSRQAYQRALQATKSLRVGTQLRGVEYWRWVLSEAKLRRLPQSTIDTAIRMIEHLAPTREPGDDREEDDLR